MRTIKQMVDWLLGEKRQPEMPPTVILGMIKREKRLIFCMPDAQYRGVSLVNVSPNLVAWYNRTVRDDMLIQYEMEALPKSRRSRKRKLKIVSLPPNPEPKYAAAIEGKA